MTQKIDKRLQKATQNGFKKKTLAQQKAFDESRKQEILHKKRLKKYLPKARAWIKEHLFRIIEEEESKGYSHFSLPKYVDDIPTEILYDLIKKISGLNISCNEKVEWEDYEQVKKLVYTVSWRSRRP